jgi:transposase-like protein
MTQRYSDDDRMDAMERLRINGGDVAKTSAETGFSQHTLRKWLRLQIIAEEVDQQAVIRGVRQEIMREALDLIAILSQKKTEASFNQLATALNQLLDKFIKLAEQLPEESEEDDHKVQIEFIDVEGNVIPPPSWTEGDLIE